LRRRRRADRRGSAGVSDLVRSVGGAPEMSRLPRRLSAPSGLGSAPHRSPIRTSRTVGVVAASRATTSPVATASPCRRAVEAMLLSSTGMLVGSELVEETYSPPLDWFGSRSPPIEISGRRRDFVANAGDGLVDLVARVSGHAGADERQDDGLRPRRLQRHQRRRRSSGASRRFMVCGAPPRAHRAPGQASRQSHFHSPARPRR
jgi:hypothetical protein